MNIDGRFLKQTAVTVTAMLLLAAYPMAAYASREVIEGAAGGVLLSLINAGMGYAAIEISFGKSYTKFIQIVMGGIVVRLFVMIGLLLVLILVVQLHVLSLVISLLVMYMALLVIEVLHINNKWQEKIHIQNS